MKFHKGQMVLWRLVGACGTYAQKEARVSRVDKGVWLSNGRGKKPSGPFSPRTGRRRKRKSSLLQIISPLVPKST